MTEECRLLGCVAVWLLEVPAVFALRSVLQLVVTVNVPSSPILVTLMVETLRSSETSIHTAEHHRRLHSSVKMDQLFSQMYWKYLLFLCT
jgi:hypothetical protein